MESISESNAGSFHAQFSPENGQEPGTVIFLMLGTGQNRVTWRDRREEKVLVIRPRTKRQKFRIGRQSCPEATPAELPGRKIIVN